MCGPDMARRASMETGGKTLIFLPTLIRHSCLWGDDTRLERGQKALLPLPQFPKMRGSELGQGEPKREGFEKVFSTKLELNCD